MTGGEKHEARARPDHSIIETWIPGVASFRSYNREWLGADLMAGLSVAAVALPIGIAYAQLAGFAPVVGIYSCILPAIAYAIFGSSRQLVVNPDAAACAIVAATVAPLASGDAARYADLSIILTLLTGVLCIIGGLIGLGVIANFLSHPILTGYLNGIALSIIAGQLGTLLGFKVPSGGFFRTLWYVGSHLNQTHLKTLLVGVSLFGFLRLLKYVAPKIPAPLLAAAIGCAVVYFLHLSDAGVAVVGPVPAGFPLPKIPSFPSSELSPLAFGACGIVLVSFCSMMTTARGFATRNGYPIKANQDMFALGVSDLASGLSGGFVVSGADSRTAVADASGGKTQLATIVAAITMTLVLLFLTRPLAFLPTAALAAILISSALSLLDIASLRTFYRVSRIEFRFAVVAMVGVMTVGVLPGVLIALGLTMLKLIRLASNPHEALLGMVDGQPDLFGAIDDGAKAIPGLTIYRFDSSLLFFNADHLKDRVKAIIVDTDPPPRWFILNAEAMPLIDITGAEALDSLRVELAKSGIVMGIARPKGLALLMLQRSGVAERIGSRYIFPTVHAGANSFRKENSQP